MSLTPPPPATRARTPPTPLHGPATNAYEPYSPRRSSRIHSRDAKYSSSSSPSAANKSLYSNSRHADSSHAPSSSSNVRVKQKRSLHRTNSQTYSPPSSPIQSPPQPRQRLHSSPRSHFKSQSSMDPAAPMGLDADSDDMGMPDTLQSRLGVDDGESKSRLGLPTPSKTPRKRRAPSDANVASAARVLFPGRLPNDEDIMPSPRKARKSKKHNAFTLESFAEESENQSEPAIEIYTDSKERIPEIDDSEENPFLVRRSARRGVGGVANGAMEETAVKGTRQGKTKYGMTKQIDEMVDNNEGMVYVFRGKKIFRRFDDNEEGNHLSAQQEGESNLSDQELRRRAGAEALRPFTRSAMKPRLLFPPKDHAATDEEEAVTDIEGDAAALPGQSSASASRPEEKVTTPVKNHFRPATPPTTGRRTRKTGETKSSSSPNSSSSPAGPSNLDGTVERDRSFRRSAGPFDSWQRTKPGSSSRSSGGGSTSVPAKRQAADQPEREIEEEATAAATASSKRAKGN